MTLPAYCRVAEGDSGAERVEQVARAVCGCWTAELPEETALQLFVVLICGSQNGGPHRLDALGAGG